MGKHVFSGHVNDNIGMYNNNNNNYDVDCDNSEWLDKARPHKKYSLYYEVK